MSILDNHSSEAKAGLRCMAIFAHPDDEVFSCGGLMILNHQRGIHNTLICATRGEAGEIALPELATRENLGAVREEELRRAAQYMEVDDLYFLGYRDSGMAGTAENRHPAAFASANPTAVVERLVRFIRAGRPHIVITFDPNGGYKHPDHIAIHQATFAAFYLAGEADYAPHLGEPWQVQRLFYPAFSRDSFDRLRDQIISQGIEAPDWGIDESDVIEQPIHALIDVSTVASRKWAAFRSHRTQFGPKHPMMVVPEEFITEWLSSEPFELAWPKEKPAVPYTDLFEGIKP